MKRERRETLKIIGAISSTCAFPFSADELYAQHNHAAPPPAKLPAKPVFFTPAEFAAITRLADLIIPETDTPGAVRAGVPAYIDYVVSRNVEARKLCREGLAWLEKQGFSTMDEAAQIRLLTPLSNRVDEATRRVRTDHPRPRAAAKLPLPAAFFRTIKSLTADGYYTSQSGLVQDLRYPGNSVLAEFPTCVHEH